jgi:hypothetical protein
MPLRGLGGDGGEAIPTWAQTSARIHVAAYEGTRYIGDDTTSFGSLAKRNLSHAESRHHHWKHAAGPKGGGRRQGFAASRRESSTTASIQSQLKSSFANFSACEITLAPLRPPNPATPWILAGLAVAGKS